MDTSGSGPSALLYVVLLAATASAARSVLGDLGRRLRRPPRAAVGLWLAVAVPSVVGLAVPAVYRALFRAPALVGDGQWWRLLTSAVVQDGGVAGAVFNLVALALVATFAVALRGAVRAVGLFVLGALAFDLAAVFLAPSPGAGNSGATFFLAASTVALVAARRRSGRALVAGTLVLALGVTLLLLRDAHGEAVVAGLVVGPLIGPGRHARGSEWTTGVHHG